MSFQIAIDGPAGAGKSTIARAVAARLQYVYVDTGAMYRAMGLYMDDCGIDASKREKVEEAAAGVHISISYQAGEQQVFLNGENVTGRVRTEKLPKAQLKIFLTASVKTRARRRFLELQQKGQSADLREIEKDIEQRDYQDTHRAASPLTQAEDAVRLDSSDLTIEEVTEKILELCRERNFI